MQISLPTSQLHRNLSIAPLISPVVFCPFVVTPAIYCQSLNWVSSASTNQSAANVTYSAFVDDGRYLFDTVLSYPESNPKQQVAHGVSSQPGKHPWGFLGGLLSPTNLNHHPRSRCGILSQQCVRCSARVPIRPVFGKSSPRIPDEGSQLTTSRCRESVVSPSPVGVGV
ncbi:hypothetical protein K456DRAFT_510170 [Colletotrichum gloeosporioides 23]|nr:hypothetical protein K456DRAFT_510170 [Colletotrichum gloeosporioides 23]